MGLSKGASKDSGHASDNSAADGLGRVETADTLRMNRTDTRDTVVEGSSRLYHDGQRRFVPMPTADPKDPLNLPEWRKIVIISTLCFFGAMAIAAEVILAALIPVFVLEYSGINPHLLDNLHGLPQQKGGGVNPNVVGLLSLFRGPPIWKTYLISTLPVLVIGGSNYFLVPLSIAIGRRPVIIVCGLLAWIGAVWAGASTSLDSHLGARALQALGAGVVETLLPLVVQDLVFIHWRNRAFSAIWAAQGIIIVTLGICSPLVLIHLSWRWLYHITAVLAAVSWLAIIIVLPETRYIRSNAELRGEPLEPLPRGFLRPALNPTKYGRRTWKTELGIFTYGIHWNKAWHSFLASIKSFFFPNIFWVICINGAFTSISLAAGQTGSSVLLTEPNSWPFKIIGLAVLPIVIASIFVALFAGYGADLISNYITKNRHNGRREPEVHLLNLIIPLLFAIAGCVMFGAGGSYIGHISWGVFVVGIGFLSFGVLSTNVILSTYVVEAYPDWAGPVLVNSGSFRNIIGFGFSFKAVDWIGQLGFMNMFGIYASVIAILGFLGIPVFVYGKQIRRVCGRFIIREMSKHGDEPLASLDPDLTVDEKGVMVADAPFEPVPVKPTKSTSGAKKPSKPAVAESAERVVTGQSSESATAATQSKAEETETKKKGIDWQNVREWLNMRDSWRDPPSH